VIDAYVRAATSAERDASPLQQTGDVTLHRVRVLDAAGDPVDSLRRDRPFRIEVRFTVNQRVPGLDMSALLFTASGMRLVDEAWSDTEGSRPDRPGTYTVRISVPPVLNIGEYRVGFWAGTAYETLLWEPGAASFRLEGSDRGRPERAVALFLPWQVVEEREPRPAAAADSGTAH